MARRGTEFQTVRSEGGLLPSDVLRRLVDPKNPMPGTRPEDYGLASAERINEAITQSWNRLKKHWDDFQGARTNVQESDAATGLTNDKWTLPVLRELGFGLLPTTAGPEVEGRAYPITRFLGKVPIHLVGAGVSLDRRSAGVAGAARLNPHGLVQEFLNRSPEHLWAIVSNGLRFRVLRDNQALSRQSFLEFDLEAMFSGEVYADFVVFWLVAHATRLSARDGGRADSCWLELWAKEAAEQGTRALKDLQGGVETALQVLGEGFTSHPRNTKLREQLREKTLTPTDLHGQLLRVVYRLIFLFVAEDRQIEGQPLLHARDDSDAGRAARELYAAHYSTARLRHLASHVKGSRHGDIWRQFQVLVVALSGKDEGEASRQALAIPALGSFLWNPDSTAALNDAEIVNHEFLEALRHLAFTRQDKILRPVDYRNLGAEELGGIYESLLALTPQVSADGNRFTFAEFAQNERKTSGSYYTPDSLVQCLLDSSLDPVVETATKGKSGADAEKAILSLKVCDPAVGSGHFLVGAAHRLARHLAHARASAGGETEPSPLLYQQALRDVIGRCLYGVDVNPMAAELCRVSLWLEALEPGKPLSFLDHHIRVGNSLLGTTPDLIAAGVPDEAFASTEADDKRACVVLSRRNAAERRGAGPLFAEEDREIQERLRSVAAELDLLPEDHANQILSKEVAFRNYEESADYRRKVLVADAWCAAFVVHKNFDEPGRGSSARGITQRDVTALASDLAPPALVELVQTLSKQFRFFHWHLAFPEVIGSGGFDCIVGNPPWVRQEQIGRAKTLLRSYESFRTTSDLSGFFLELSIRILRQMGLFALLLPNKWFRADYAAELRLFVRSCCRLTLVIDFGHSRSLFPDADTFPAAVVAQKTGSRQADQSSFPFLACNDELLQRQELKSAIGEASVQVCHAGLTDSRWLFEGSAESGLLERLVREHRSLVSYIGRPLLWGLKTGFNEAFYLNQTQADALSDSAGTQALVRPLLRGRDIRRWTTGRTAVWQITIRSSQEWQWPWSSCSEADAETVFAQSYPTLHSHLKQYEPQLRARQDQGRYWWELRSCEYYEAFTLPKICAQSIAYHSAFGIDLEGRLQNNSSVLVPTDDYFVLGVLNSRLVWWLMAKTFPHKKDEAIAIDVNLLARVPIPDCAETLKDSIRSAVRVLADAASDIGIAERVALETQLDGFVNQAFGLTSDECAAIARSLPPRDPLALLQGLSEPNGL